MSTPTLPRIDLSELGFQDWNPAIPCEIHTVKVGKLCTPKCDAPATLLVVGHKRHWTTFACEPCWKLYVYLADSMQNDTLICSVCGESGGSPLFWTEPL